jgi:NAD-dependent deacetylase
VWTLTQNVDGFHHDAGSKNVIPIHGDLRRIRCSRCRFRENVTTYAHLPDVPTCACGATLRPDVVLFGEMLPVADVFEMKTQLRQGFDITFTIGTTSVFPYISYPIELANQRDKPSVEINPGTTGISSSVRYRLPLTAAVALDAIWTRFRKAS